METNEMMGTVFRMLFEYTGKLNVLYRSVKLLFCKCKKQ